MLLRQSRPCSASPSLWVLSLMDKGKVAQGEEPNSAQPSPRTLPRCAQGLRGERRERAGGGSLTFHVLLTLSLTQSQCYQGQQFKRLKEAEGQRSPFQALQVKNE